MPGTRGAGGGVVRVEEQALVALGDQRAVFHIRSLYHAPPRAVKDAAAQGDGDSDTRIGRWSE